MKTLINLTPASDFRAFEDAFERMFATPVRPATPAATIIPVDLSEREGKFVVRAAVPGIDPSELDVQVEQNILTLRGESKVDGEIKDEKVYRREFGYGQFSRSVRLPENLDLNAIDAEFKNGIVTISIPRIVEEKPKALKVNIRQAETSAN